MKAMHKFLGIGMFLLTLLSCGDDDTPDVINEEETITTVNLSVTKEGTDETMIYTWKEDNKDPIPLEANSSYNIKIKFLDESDPSDVEDITEEVIEEKDEHFVFYQTTVAGLNFAPASDDVADADNVSINISTDWTTGEAGTGIIKAFLIHEPTTKTGDERDDFGGETDIEVDFDVTIQ